MRKGPFESCPDATTLATCGIWYSYIYMTN